MTIRFSTKASTLRSLQGTLRSAQIADLLVFTVGEWRGSPDKWRVAAKRDLGESPWIVRSSCAREDTHDRSNAGAFLSVLNVTESNLESAINQVIDSYGTTSEADQVLIQPQLRNVVRSGVAFSHDPTTCAPYRVINWVEGSNTAAVTGGLGGRTWQSAAGAPACPLPELAPVLALLEELEGIFQGVPLDCEFAVTRDGNHEILWLLQARPLNLRSASETTSEQTKRLQRIYSKVKQGMQPHPFLKGRRTVYGVMPDWNPAEIVGVRPKPLALSLYRELVTDSIWAYQRHNYGYRNLRSFPLMPHFFGLPYIDVRLSFNSFIPADLDHSLAGRLVDYYINRLLEEPKLHDKVEFEIVFSCYTLDLPERLHSLAGAGFSDSELKTFAESLRVLTNRICNPVTGLWKKDAAKLDVLNSRREQLMSTSSEPIEKIYWLLEDGKRYGTLPFAGLARAGFIAIQMLKSLVSVGVFSQADYDAFLGGVSTVSGQLAHDRATLDKAIFLGRYGHLRPGTYDILSYRYDERPDLYFNWEDRPPKPKESSPFSVTLPQMRQVADLLKAHELEADPVGLFDFIQAGVELRELSKFYFTRNLSDALVLITQYGEALGFSREDLAFCDISVFRELHVGAVDPLELLRESIQRGRARYEETLRVSLPPLIAEPDQVWAFEWPETSPNFITQKQVTARVVDCSSNQNLAGAVVCIPNADPGFDWLFSYPIAGLITAWGGCNSHMAIRASELGLPAVIGAGEVLYRRWSSAERLYLDCAGRKVEVLA
jgi:hypothetical protein